MSPNAMQADKHTEHVQCLCMLDICQEALRVVDVARCSFRFIKGDTNANHLTEKGVRTPSPLWSCFRVSFTAAATVTTRIWEANGSREFLDKRGLSHREDGRWFQLSWSASYHFM